MSSFVRGRTEAGLHDTGPGPRALPTSVRVCGSLPHPLSVSTPSFVNTPNEKSSTFFHPATGVLILILDWVLFSGNVLSLGLSTVAVSSTGFVLATVGTLWIQRRYTPDGRWGQRIKGLLAGIAVGLPFPIAGTAGGAAILALSGLDRRRGRKKSSDSTDELPGSENGAS